jgi:hypothetical protein
MHDLHEAMVDSGRWLIENPPERPALAAADTPSQQFVSELDLSGCKVLTGHLNGGAIRGESSRGTIMSSIAPTRPFGVRHIPDLAAHLSGLPGSAAASADRPTMAGRYPFLQERSGQQHRSGGVAGPQDPAAQ